MLLVVFEPTILASGQPQTHALHGEAPGIGLSSYTVHSVLFCAATLIEIWRATWQLTLHSMFIVRAHFMVEFISATFLSN